MQLNEIHIFQGADSASVPTLCTGKLGPTDDSFLLATLLKLTYFYIRGAAYINIDDLLLYVP